MKPDKLRILTINGGSSSIKFALFEADGSPRRMLEGAIDRIGQAQATLRVKGLDLADNFSRPLNAPDHPAAVGALMDWIVERGVERIPEGVSFERATLVEPLNTCLKAVVECDPQPGEFVAILGQGPIGLMFTMLVHRSGARIASTDAIPERLAVASRCGADFTWNPRQVAVADEIKRLTEGRGADLVIVAASVPGIVDQAMACSRPGKRNLRVWYSVVSCRWRN